MSDGTDELSRILKGYERELVRWNRQVNLVSRQETPQRVAELVQQCRTAWRQIGERLAAVWDRTDRVLYFDLGSGGGLPGLVWHHHLVRAFAEVQTTLVEPREKRAWFLERQRGLDPDHPFEVRSGRWGEDSGVLTRLRAPSRVLISLKALHMTEPAVLLGLERALGGSCLPMDTEVTIARFAPPDQKWSDQVGAELDALWPFLDTEINRFNTAERAVIPPGPGGSASLIVSFYAATPRP